MNWGGRWLGLAVLALMLLAGCSTAPINSGRGRPVQGPSVPTPGQDGFPEPGTVPPDLSRVPNAVPRPELRSAAGNPPEYEVFGKVYHVRKSARGYDRTGYASWYGRKFQGKPTASGEPYDMFKMTAASKTLPIPSFARVTNLANGKTVIVRINDRGPFHRGRIIDLSYVAALKLGMLGKGSARVRVQALLPRSRAQRTAWLDRHASVAPHALARPATGHSSEAAGAADQRQRPRRSPALYLRVGVFRYRANAIALRNRLRSDGYAPLAFQRVSDHGQSLVAVLVGPFTNRRARQVTQRKLRTLQIASVPLTQ